MLKFAFLLVETIKHIAMCKFTKSQAPRILLYIVHSLFISVPVYPGYKSPNPDEPEQIQKSKSEIRNKFKIKNSKLMRLILGNL